MARVLAAILLAAATAGCGSVGSALPLDAEARITAASLKEHVGVLASDELQGRNSGYPGNDKAAEYIAAHFRKIGLTPAGDRDTWFQAFTVRERPTRNVVGLAEGTDPFLKSEYVVIGAHHDHAGQDGEDSPGRARRPSGGPSDSIWNGADDNASGTATVLEIARAYKESGRRAKRSILFVTFSGEEWGLVGSKHFVDHPPVALANVVAMINLDMVGRNGSNPMDVGGTGTAAGWEDLCEAAAAGTGLKYTPSPGVLPGSDHYSFARKKIPAVHFFTGFHGDYHLPTDHVDKIDFERMERIGRFGLRLLTLLADLEPRMAFAASGPRVLGVEMNGVDRGNGEGGLEISLVTSDSVAERAGLRSRDMLIEFNGRPLPATDPMGAFRKELRSVRGGVPVPMVVIRQGMRMELSAMWDGNP